MDAGSKALRVRVNDELTLDAGWWEESPADDGTLGRRIHPPEVTLFEQVHEESERTWAERVLPYHLAQGLLVTPTGWSLDERTRPVWLPGEVA